MIIPIFFIALIFLVILAAILIRILFIIVVIIIFVIFKIIFSVFKQFPQLFNNAFELFSSQRLQSAGTGTHSTHRRPLCQNDHRNQHHQKNNQDCCRRPDQMLKKTGKQSADQASVKAGLPSLKIIDR